MSELGLLLEASFNVKKDKLITFQNKYKIFWNLFAKQNYSMYRILAIISQFVKITLL